MPDAPMFALARSDDSDPIAKLTRLMNAAFDRIKALEARPQARGVTAMTVAADGEVSVTWSDGSSGTIGRVAVGGPRTVTKIAVHERDPATNQIIRTTITEEPGE